jgi:ankyrin repeat protein
MNGSYLLNACRKGSYETVRLIIEAGVGVDVLDQQSYTEDGTPLCVAARLGHTSIVKLLLKSKANVHSQCTSGQTALVKAASFGHIDTVLALLAHGAEVPAQAIMKAAAAGFRCTVQLLVPLYVTCGGCNIAHYLAQIDLSRSQNPEHLRTLRLVLDAGGEDFVNKPDYKGAVPLLLAIRRRNMAIAELLVSAKANVNATDPDGTPLLTHACFGPGDAVSRLLLEARTDANATDVTGKTALFAAICSDNVAAVETLLRHGADPMVVDESGGSSLHHECQASVDNARAMKMLFEHILKRNFH